MKQRENKVALIILDGWGYSEEKENNAIAEAKTPFFDKIWQENPHAILEASGTSVGLPEGQTGGSEIGHLVIGAGRPIKTDLVRINDAIVNGEFERNPAFLEVFNHVKKYDSSLHIAGLIGTGGIHAHSDHLFALLRAAKKAKVKNIFLHVFTDGRDTPPKESARFIEELEKVNTETGVGFISTISGRYFAMDRDFNWDRFEKAEKAMFQSKGTRSCGKNPSVLLKELYGRGMADEHLEPVIFVDINGNTHPIETNDGVIMLNFRADRARMFSQKILQKKHSHNICYVTMTEYDKNFDCLVAFPPENIETTLAKEISDAGLIQFHTAETEKYAHATYFLNGGVEAPYKNEFRVMIESRKDIKTPDEAPELRAKEVTKAVIEYLDKANFLFVNYANTDLVGHSGNKEAIIQSVEEVDRQLKKLAEAIVAVGGVAIITADHGNAEVNIDQNGQKHTAHTNNPVPLILVSYKGKIRGTGTLADIAPTVLNLLNLPIPPSMNGKSLILEN